MMIHHEGAIIKVNFTSCEKPADLTFKQLLRLQEYTDKPFSLPYKHLNDAQD